MNGILGTAWAMLLVLFVLVFAAPAVDKVDSLAPDQVPRDQAPLAMCVFEPPSSAALQQEGGLLASTLERMDRHITYVEAVDDTCDSEAAFDPG